jgi:CheY-like chemotaxis protein
MLDELSAQYPVPVRPVPVEPAAVYRLPILEDVVGPPRVALPPVAARAEPALTVAPPTVAPVPPVPPAAPGAAKAAARAAARRARLATSRTAPQTEPLRDVLVFDADDAASALLSALLERFGFRSHAVQSVDQADEQLETRPFAAFFLDIALDDADRGEGLALVRRIHQLAVPEGHPAPAVLMVTAHLNPADRVRASLAGIGALLLKPVTRGDAARALESCGVTLPADARRP